MSKFINSFRFIGVAIILNYNVHHRGRP